MPHRASHHLRQTIRAATILMSLAPVLDARGAGRRKRSLRQVAAMLNDAEVPTRTGGQWWPEGVRRALAEAERARLTLKGLSEGATVQRARGTARPKGLSPGA